MEEILASIRRIIADDDATKPPPRAPDPPPAPPAAPLTRAVNVAPRPAPPPPPRPAPPPEPVAKDEIDLVLGDPDPPPAPPVEPAPDVLELTEDMAAAAAPAPDSFRTIDGQSDVAFEEGTDDQQADAQPRMYLQDLPERELMSAVTTAAVDSAFNTLAQTVLVHNARTLEDLVKEMLRPMLKTWLDDNLPGLVERLVRAEIERVSRGRG